MAESLFGFFILAGLLIVGALLLAIFFNLTMQRSMAAVSKKNQTISPGLIWLNLIPIPVVNTIWTMVFGIKTCIAINTEVERKIAPLTLAIVYPSISLLVSVLSLFSSLIGRNSYESNQIISLMIIILSIAGLVLFIIFWVQLNNAKNKLKGIYSVPADSETLDSGFIDDGI